MKAGHFVYSKPGEEAVELITVEDETRKVFLTPTEATNLAADLFRFAMEIANRDRRFLICSHDAGSGLGVESEP